MSSLENDEMRKEIFFITTKKKISMNESNMIN